jgi:hypothetical protein
LFREPLELKAPLEVRPTVTLVDVAVSGELLHVVNAVVVIGQAARRSEALASLQAVLVKPLVKEARAFQALDFPPRSGVARLLIQDLDDANVWVYVGICPRRAFGGHLVASDLRLPMFIRVFETSTTRTANE